MFIMTARQELRDLRWSAVGFALGAAIYVLVIIGFFPTVRDNSQAYKEMMDVYPEALKEIFGIEDLATLPEFIGAEVLSLIWPIVIAVFVITTATGFVAGEIEHGTVDLWLSAPVQRWRLLAGKIVALLLGVAAIVAATVASIWVGAILVGESLSVTGYSSLFVILYVFALALAGYSSLLSASMSERGKAGGLAAIITLLGYLAWIVASLSPRWDWLRFFSIFTAFDPQSSLADGRLSVVHVAILLAVALVCFMAALIVFERRDAVG